MDQTKACGIKNSFLNKSIYTCCYTVAYMGTYGAVSIMDFVSGFGDNNPVSAGLQDGVQAAWDTLEQQAWDEDDVDDV